MLAVACRKFPEVSGAFVTVEYVDWIAATRHVILLWAQATPRAFLAFGSDRELSQSVSNREPRRLSFPVSE